MADSKSANAAIVDSYDETSHALRTTATIGDVELGQVEIKDSSSSTAAKVASSASGVATSDPALAVQASVLGLEADAAVNTNTTGTISGKLRGMIAIFLDVLGVSSGAKVVTDAAGSIQQYLRGLVSLWIAGLAAGEAHIGSVGGSIVQLRTTFTRPGDANAYAANDAVNNSTSAPTALTFSGAVRNNAGTGYIVGAEIIHEVVSVTPRLRLYLFNATPTLNNDNATYAPTYAVVGLVSFLGVIDFDPMTSLGGSDFSRAQNFNIRIPFKCATSDTALYGLVQTLDAFTPGNAKGVTVKLLVDQN